MAHFSIARAWIAAALGFAPLVACAAAAQPTLGETLKEGHYSVDGQALPATRDVPLECKPLETFRYRTAVGDIVLLGGGPSAPTKLRLTIFEAKPNDAIVGFDAGAISLRSRTGNPIGLTHLRGTLASNCALALSSVGGRITVSGFDTSGDIDLDAVNGAVAIDGGKADAIKIRCDGGAIRLSNVTANRATIEAGGGAVELVECHIGELQARSASGSLTLRGGDYGLAVLESPEGDMVFEHTRVVAATARSITGNVVARDATFVDSPSFHSVRGEIRR